MSTAMNTNGQASMRMTSSTVAFTTLSAGVLGIAALASVDANALCLLPALAIAVPFLLCRYPGERVLARLSVARRPRRQRPRAIARRTGRLLTVAPHGGLLIARSLAVRPPPALPHSAS